MMKEDILIIAHNFPPMGGVGTRRWSKFSKYLASRGYNVHVLTINYGYKDTVNWEHDIEHPNITIHRTDGKYPTWLLSHNKKKFIRKKISEVYKLYLKRTTNWLDSAQGWEKTMIPYALELIEERNIKNVMVTGAPFSVLYMSSFLKIENPDINLIMDYRDSWNDERHFKYKSAIKRFDIKEKSVIMEQQCMYYADKVIFTSDATKRQNAKVYKTEASKFYTLYNGYDPSDFNVSDNQKRTSTKMNLVYLGGLMSGRELGLNLIAQAISELNDPFFKEYFCIDFFGKIPINYINPDPEIFHFKGLVSPKLIHKVLSNYFCGLSIAEKKGPHAIASKVFDYMGYGMPIFHLSEIGELYNILNSKGQFVSNYNVENLKRVLLNLKKCFLSNHVDFNPDYSEYSLENITLQLEQIFE